MHYYKGSILTMKVDTYILSSAVHDASFFEESGEIIFALAKRNKSPLSLAVVDIDNLSLINETYEKKYGDELIKKCADIIINSCRKSDLVGYMGEGKFALLLYNISGINANIMLNGLRQKLYQGLNSDPEDKLLKKSVSIGATILYTFETNEQLKELFTNAHIALNRAKLNGKNKVIIH